MDYPLTKLREFCELCGSSGRTLHTNLTDNLFAAPGAWDMRACSNRACQLLWLDPQPLPSEIHKLYRSYYTHTPITAGSANHSIASLRRGVKCLLSFVIFWNSHAFRSDFLHLEGMPPGRVLDIGCGSGGFLSSMQKRGWETFGIDFDPNAVAAARSLPGVKAEVGELIGQKYESDFFDAIVMNNVIEHVWNPASTIKECYRILRANGRLVLITPNSRSLGHALFGRHWRGLEPPRHLFIYNNTAMKSLLRESGLTRHHVFSSAGADSGRQMLVSSLRTSRSGDKSKLPSISISAMLWWERLSCALGGQRGEWIVGVAKK